MYSSTFLRVQLDLNVFLPARVSYTCVTYGLLLTKRYVYPPPKGSLVYYMYMYMYIYMSRAYELHISVT